MAASIETRRIIHQNGATFAERVIRERVVSTSDWLNELQKSAPSPSRLLPPDCIDNFGSRARNNVNYRIYITMMLPRVVSFVFRDRDRQIRNLNLSWPYTLWWFVFANQNLVNVFLTAAKRSPFEIANYMDLELFHLPVPNQYPEGHFCLGNVEVDVRLPEWKRVNVLRNNILGSNWNTDLMPAFTGLPFANLIEWDTQSKDNPNLWTVIPFRPYVYPTYRKMMEHIVDTQGGE